MVAHDLANRLHNLDLQQHAPILENAQRALFKLSNHQAYIQIGSDPVFQNGGIDWRSFKGREYELFEEVLDKVRIIESGNR
jgi:hypothetical protein